jgi:hypothetical protein
MLHRVQLKRLTEETKVAYTPGQWAKLIRKSKIKHLFNVTEEMGAQNFKDVGNWY